MHNVIYTSAFDLRYNNN